ncbi:MAG: hypothetical protein WCY81_07655 [Sphaerochaetaceae bacterium]|jgi:hypothetical protein
MKKVLAILLALIVLTGVVFADEGTTPPANKTADLTINATVGLAQTLTLTTASMDFTDDDYGTAQGSSLKYTTNSPNGYKVLISGTPLADTATSNKVTTVINYTITPGVISSTETADTANGGSPASSAFETSSTSEDPFVFVTYSVRETGSRTVTLPFTVLPNANDWAAAATASYGATVTFELVSQN